MNLGRPPVEKTRPEDRKPARAPYRAPTVPAAKPAARPVPKPAAAPFAQGVSVGGKADAIPRGGGRWRVFLFPTGSPPFMADVADATGPEDATAKAWETLKAKREETARRNGGR